MKHLTSFLSFIVIFLWTALFPANAQVNVTQEHNNLSRDGHYIDAAFTPANAANLTRDLNFDGTIAGHVYAQPLYIEGGPNGPMVIAVTESNNVVRAPCRYRHRDLAPHRHRHAGASKVVHARATLSPLASPARLSSISTSRSLFFDALISGNPKKHFIYSLNVDTGATHANWPVDVDATAGTTA